MSVVIFMEKMLLKTWFCILPLHHLMLNMRNAVSDMKYYMIRRFISFYDF